MLEPLYLSITAHGITLQPSERTITAPVARDSLLETSPSTYSYTPRHTTHHEATRPLIQHPHPHRRTQHQRQRTPRHLTRPARRARARTRARRSRPTRRPRRRPRNHASSSRRLHHSRGAQHLGAESGIPGQRSSSASTEGSDNRGCITSDGGGAGGAGDDDGGCGGGGGVCGGGGGAAADNGEEARVIVVVNALGDLEGVVVCGGEGGGGRPGVGCACCVAWR